MRAFDVVVMGGGIHGAGVLQATVAAGHSALLIEKSALASGTSSRSSKFIHGGLRYLESGQFALVRESLHERAVHLRIAPDLVSSNRFSFRSTRRRAAGPGSSSSGCGCMRCSADSHASMRFGSVPRREWPQLDGLKTRDLDAVIRYYDAQTDDAQLTRAVVESARALGGELAMPARFRRRDAPGRWRAGDLRGAAARSRNAAPGCS